MNACMHACMHVCTHVCMLHRHVDLRVGHQALEEAGPHTFQANTDCCLCIVWVTRGPESCLFRIHRKLPMRSRKREAFSVRGAQGLNPKDN